jgi:hypothetical protein
MSALQRQTYANQTNALFVKTSGNSTVDGVITAELFTTNGTVGSQGLRLANEQYISFTDEPASPVVEGLRIYSAETVTPGQTFASIAVQPGSLGLFFNQIGQSANSYILPGPFSLATPTDQFVIGGTTTTRFLNLGAPSCGTGTIAIGATNVVISSTAVAAGSKIFLTFFGSPSAGPGKGVSQGNLIVNQGLIVPATSFRVDLTDADGVSLAAANVAVTFNWMVIN